MKACWKGLAVAVLGLGAGLAQAGGVNWSIGINLPPVSTVISNDPYPHRPYYGAAPVYAPPPVVYRPAPVYYVPPPVVYRPAPVAVVPGYVVDRRWAPHHREWRHHRGHDRGHRWHGHDRRDDHHRGGRGHGDGH